MLGPNQKVIVVRNLEPIDTTVFFHPMPRLSSGMGIISIKHVLNQVATRFNATSTAMLVEDSLS